MKIRIGFVSNSSTASFVVKTRPDNYDKRYEFEFPTLLPDEKQLLVKCGFVPTIRDDPFNLKLDDDYDDIYLARRIDSNHRTILQFLVAHNFPFKASVYYKYHLYSYERDDKYIYILDNFGIRYVQSPKDIEKDTEEEGVRNRPVPFKKVAKDEFLKDYDEEDALLLMGGADED